jgi:hypothetical protein
VVVVSFWGATARPALGQTSPYDRNCGTAREGGLTTNERWETIGPWHVRMSYKTARSIAERVGPSEFQPSGSHPSPKDVPCVVASSVAFAAADAWSVRHATSEWISARWTGYASGPSFGGFHCIVTTPRAGTVGETCTHQADRHAGQITVQLTVRPAPKSP